MSEPKFLLDNTTEQILSSTDIFERTEEQEAEVPFLRQTLNFVKQYYQSRSKGRQQILAQ